MKRFWLLFAAAVLLVACDNKFEDEMGSIQGVSTLPIFTAEFAEKETRTYVEDNLYLRWHEGDLISAFVGNTRNSRYVFEGNTGDKSGTFGSTDSSLGSSEKLDSNYALYPYDKGAKISTDGVISCSLPATQEYAEESFGKGANTMVAVTKSTDDTFLAFKNACGYLKVKLYGNATIKSIELKGNNGEKIAGEASITATYGGVPTVAMADDATESITLDCGEGVKLSADAEKPTEFWFVVPPTEFSEGLTIVATDIYGTTFVKSTSNAVTITRNEIQPMATLEAIFPDPTKPAYNEIWYTSSDGEIVKPYSTNVFGANIVSNKYNDGKGVITFDGNITTIGFAAFAYCYSLTSVTIPDSVTTIGESAFANCTSLTSVTIPDSVTTIGDAAFTACTSLTSVTIGDGVTTIGRYAFYECFSLTSVTIPDSVTTIGDTAFAYCRRLTSVTIGDSVTTIGKGAFAYCTSLKEFKGKFAADNGRCLIVDGVLNSFAIGCGATEYTIPDSVTTIGGRAFFYCDSLTSVYCKATTPPSLDDYAFNYNHSDRKIYVPRGCGSAYKSAPYWDDYAADIVEYDFETGEVVPEGQHNNEIWYTSSDSEIVKPYRANVFGANIVSNNYKDGKGVITFDGDVAAIGEMAFSYCTSLTSVTIPDSVTTIGEEAFVYCSSLTSVTIPDSVTTIGDEAFFGCISLTSVTNPDGVTTIGDAAFAGCTSLKEFKGKFASDNGRCLIVDGVLNSFAIGCGATEYTIPNSVTTIGIDAFYNCTSLTSVTIPDSVTAIWIYAFAYCRSLTSVTIGDGVTTIGDSAFSGCTSLTSVYCKATTPPSLGDDAFKDYSNGNYINIGCTIYVPRGCGEAYKSAPNWNDYAADIVEYDFESGESGGNDDGGESGENELWARWIIGTWETTQAYIGGEWLDIPSDTDMYATMSFYADGSYYGDSELFGTGWGTYTLSGDTVNTYYDGVLYYTYTIKSMTETSAEVTMAYGTANIPIRLRKQ